MGGQVQAQNPVLPASCAVGACSVLITTYIFHPNFQLSNGHQPNKVSLLWNECSLVSRTEGRWALLSLCTMHTLRDLSVLSIHKAKHLPTYRAALCIPQCIPLAVGNVLSVPWQRNCAEVHPILSPSLSHQCCCSLPWGATLCDVCVLALPLCPVNTIHHILYWNVIVFLFLRKHNWCTSILLESKKKHKIQYGIIVKKLIIPWHSAIYWPNKIQLSDVHHGTS